MAYVLCSGIGHGVGSVHVCRPVQVVCILFCTGEYSDMVLIRKIPKNN